MQNVLMFDCTLREYFSYFSSLEKKDIEEIAVLLSGCNLDYIECGHIRNRDICESLLMNPTPQDFDWISHKCKQKFSVIMDLNRYNIKELPFYSGGAVSAIRLCFKKGEIKTVLQTAYEIINKGYDLFIQHVDFVSYSYSQIHQFLRDINCLSPSGYCIVDTFGNMQAQDLQDAIRIVSSHLNKNIQLGFHGHNNRMLANSLCCDFLNHFDLRERTLTIDSSIMGLGRGAGNANTEILSLALNKDNIIQIINCVEFICEYYHLSKMPFAYYLTGIFDAHTFIADAIIDQAGSLSLLYRSLLLSSDEERKRYDSDNIDKMIERGRERSYHG